MQTRFPSTGRLFDTRQIVARPVPAGIVLALTGQEDLCVEVTFDSRGLDPAAYTPVELVSGSRDRAVHLSIRPGEGRIVLNTRDGHAWGTESSAAIDLGLLHYWRLWLCLSTDGACRVRLGGAALCAMDTGIPATDVGTIRSQVSVHCVLPPEADGSVVTGLFDQDAPGGPVALLLPAPGVEAAAADWTLAQDGQPVPVEDLRAVQIAGATWWALRLAPETRAAAIEVTAGDGTARLDEVRARPMVELTAAHVVLRSPVLPRADAVSWVTPQGDDRTATRFVTSGRENRDPRGWTFQRAYTPLSEFLRLVPADGGTVTLGLVVDDLPGLGGHLTLGAPLHAAMQDWVGSPAAAAPRTGRSGAVARAGRHRPAAGRPRNPGRDGGRPRGRGDGAAARGSARDLRAGAGAPAAGPGPGSDRPRRAVGRRPDPRPRRGPDAVAAHLGPGPAGRARTVCRLRLGPRKAEGA